VKGNGKVSGKRTIEAFGRHIKPGSRLIKKLPDSKNPPENKYEKIDKILELGFQKSVLLRYRGQKR
jgi:hypothetical protein